jgi:hypothetical protein
MTPIEYLEFDIASTTAKLVQLRGFATNEDRGLGLCDLGSKISFEEGKLEALSRALYHAKNPERIKDN